MRLRPLTLILAAAITLFAQADITLQRAMRKETLEGDLNGAIALYKQAVAEAKNDRGIAAKALLRMAECHQKLGDAKARKIYEQVVRDFADQKEAAVARQKLAGTDTRASGIIARQIWADAIDGEGQPSPDGQYLSFVDWTTGDLAIRDLATHENRRLTNKGPWSGSEDFALDSLFSPDGKQVAFSWFNSKNKNSWELRMVPTAGPSSQRVLYRNDDLEIIRPFDWSPDGKEILTLFRRKDRTHQIAMVSVADGSARMLKTFDWRAPFKMSLSPDGRYIAYDFPPAEDSQERDIFVLSSDGSRERIVLQDPANDTFPVWSPDGSRIMFVSDRAGSNGIWIVPVADGRAAGQPELIKADVGPLTPMAITRKGSLFYGLMLRDTTVYVSALDLRTGSLTQPLTPVNRPYTGNNFSADWSPDGGQLAYFSRRGLSQQRGSMLICIRSSDTGKEREFITPLAYIGGLRWSPNGRALVIWGTDDKGKKGIFEFDAVTGAIAPIVATGEDFRDPMWSPDGRTLYYRSSRVIARDRETGREREIVPGPMATNYMALSRDGSKLALLVEHLEKRAMGIYVVPTAGGEVREILTLPEGISGMVLEWEPSGRNVIFARAKNTELWRVSAEGGQLEKLNLGMKNAAVMRTFRFHPDGRQIAFTSGQAGKSEVWTLENFLPTLRSKQ